MNETVKRILGFMEQKGDNANSLQVKVKLPRGSVFGWKNDKFKPSTEAIIKLARYFNVSADYLLCLSDDPKPLMGASVTKRTISPLSTELAKDQRFVNSAKLYNAMPNKFQSEVYLYIFGVAAGLGLNVKQILGR